MNVLTFVCDIVHYKKNHLKLKFFYSIITIAVNYSLVFYSQSMLWLILLYGKIQFDMYIVLPGLCVYVHVCVRARVSACVRVTVCVLVYPWSIIGHSGINSFIAVIIFFSEQLASSVLIKGLVFSAVH